MPFVTNQGIRIHYESIGSGPALVMHHGSLCSGTDLIDCGYVDALKIDYQVILLDSRGHGQSDKPHDPRAYDLALRASDVVAVLDELGVRKADYFGYSLGGWIGFGLARHSLERFSSFIFVGSHPYAENMQPFRDWMPKDRDAFSVVLDRIFGDRLPPATRARLLANDLVALRMLTQDRETNADVMASMIMPCLLVVGELDPRLAHVRQCASELPNATFVSLPGWDHADLVVRGDLVIPHLKAFLSKVHG
jgi:pimeloyl-ACP methyl ester carboxylesterase